MKTRIMLIHICCGPCLIYPLEELQAQGYTVHGYYCNPNTFPFAEYERRRHTAAHYAAENNCTFLAEEYRPEEFEETIGSVVCSPHRCLKCWQLRLRATAAYAYANGFPVFTTTLLVSPYQDTMAIKTLAEAAAGEAGVKFYFRDFREGFRQAQQVARHKEMYRQKYCGCRFSLAERGERVTVS